MARRTIAADVASRRYRIAVATNAGLSEYGSTKFGVTPDGGERAGLRLLALLLSMMLFMLMVREASQNSSPSCQLYIIQFEDTAVLVNLLLR